MSKNIKICKVIISSIAGTIIGASAAALLLTKKGASWQERLSDKFEEWKGGCNPEQCCDKIKCSMNKILDLSEGSPSPLILGAIGVGVIGLSTILYLSHQGHPGYERKGGNISEWLCIAKEAAEAIDQKLQEREEEESFKGSSIARDILDWTRIGLNIWQHTSGKR